MSTASRLTRADYEEFLVYLYFRSRQDYLINCIRRSYLDFSRTLHGISVLPEKDRICDRASDALYRFFNELQSGQVVLDNPVDFDRWHKAACLELSKIYEQEGYMTFYVGQAQKWINMTFKYIFTLGAQRIDGFDKLYRFCHVPLDNIIVECLSPYGLRAFSCTWSRLNDYEEYLAYQREIRRRFELAPLDVEFWLWLGEELPRSPSK
jgi:hypothetical protein